MRTRSSSRSPVATGFSSASSYLSSCSCGSVGLRGAVNCAKSRRRATCLLWQSTATTAALLSTAPPQPDHRGRPRIPCRTESYRVATCEAWPQSGSSWHRSLFSVLLSLLPRRRAWASRRGCVRRRGCAGESRAMKFRIASRSATACGVQKTCTDRRLIASRYRASDVNRASTSSCGINSQH